MTNPLRSPSPKIRRLNKRILESLAGVRDPKAPKIQTLRGPELTDREKVIHVLTRLGFGAKPGEVDQILKNGGWEAWVKLQMDPAKIDDATADRVVSQRYKFAKMSMTELQKEYDGDGQNIRQLHKELPESIIARSRP